MEYPGIRHSGILMNNNDNHDDAGNHSNRKTDTDDNNDLYYLRIHVHEYGRMNVCKET